MGYFYDLMKTLKQKEQTIPKTNMEGRTESTSSNHISQKTTQPTIPSPQTAVKTPKG